MAIIETTVYLDSNGKRYTKLEEADLAQEAINKSASRVFTDDYIDAFIDAAAKGGNSKYWGLMSQLKNTSIRRLKVSRSNLGDIMTDLINNDLVSLYNLAMAIAYHTYDLPKDLSRPTIPGKDGEPDKELPGGLIEEFPG